MPEWVDKAIELVVGSGPSTNLRVKRFQEEVDRADYARRMRIRDDELKYGCAPSAPQTEWLSTHLPSPAPPIQYDDSDPLTCGFAYTPYRGEAHQQTYRVVPKTKHRNTDYFNCNATATQQYPKGMFPSHPQATFPSGAPLTPDSLLNNNASASTSHDSSKKASFESGAGWVSTGRFSFPAGTNLKVIRTEFEEDCSGPSTAIDDDGCIIERGFVVPKAPTTRKPSNSVYYRDLPRSRQPLPDSTYNANRSSSFEDIDLGPPMLPYPRYAPPPRAPSMSRAVTPRASDKNSYGSSVPPPSMLRAVTARVSDEDLYSSTMSREGRIKRDADVRIVTADKATNAIESDDEDESEDEATGSSRGGPGRQSLPATAVITPMTLRQKQDRGGEKLSSTKDGGRMDHGKRITWGPAAPLLRRVSAERRNLNTMPYRMAASMTSETAERLDERLRDTRRSMPKKYP